MGGKHTATYAPPLRYTDTLTIDLFLFVLCLRLEKKRSPMKNLDSFFFFPSDCFFFCVAMSDVLTSHLHFSAQSGWLSVFAFLLCFDQEKKKQTLGSLN